MTPASSAARITTARIPAPTAMFRFRAAYRRHVGRAPASAIADPRIDEDVEDVDHEIDQYVRRRGDQDDALHHRVVAAQYRGEDEAPQAGHVAADLGADGPAEQERHRAPDSWRDGAER